MNIPAFFLALLLVLSTSLQAQFTLHTKPDSMSFSELQRQFNSWREKNDLNTTKGWKYYKRWEQEQLMHTLPNGEPVSAEEYLKEILTATSSKQQPGQNIIFSNYAWVPMGPQSLPEERFRELQLGVGRINCIAFHPTSEKTYWVGVAQGGIWKTTDDGLWAPKTDHLPILRISSIAVDPTNPSVLYAAFGDYEYLSFGLLANGRKRNTYYGIGVYKSTDGGESWNPTGLSFSLDGGEATLLCKVIVHPDKPNTVIAVGATGCYITHDAGKTWTNTKQTLFWDLVPDHMQPTTLYAATGHIIPTNYGVASILKSSDFGESWTELNTGIPRTGVVERIKIAVAPNDNKYVYAITTDSSFGLYAIYKSTDAGKSWVKKFDFTNVLETGLGKAKGGQGTYDLSLIVHPTNKNILYTGGINIWASTDGGNSFNPVSYWKSFYGKSIHADHHAFYFNKLTNDFFVCNDGGLYRTRELVPTPWEELFSGSQFETIWEPLSTNMAITSYYRLSSSQNNAERVVAGAQDNGSAYYNGTKWYGATGGDGMDNWIDKYDQSSFITSWQYGVFQKTVDGGYNFTKLEICDEVGEWTTPLVSDYKAPGYLYAGYGNVYSSSNQGNTWEKISAFPTHTATGLLPEICAMSVSKSHPEVLVVAKRLRYEYKIPGACYRTTDRGKNWQNISAGLPDSLYITSVDISDDNPDIVWVSCAGFSKGNKVYKTTNGGKTWQNISYNLPNLPVNVVKHVPSSVRHLLLVGTDIGVYCINDSLQQWTQYSNGLPNVIITDLEVNTTNKAIYASTFGRGIWITDLIENIPIETRVDEQDYTKSPFLFPSVVHAREPITLSLSDESEGDILIEVADILGKRIDAIPCRKTTPTLHQKIISPPTPGIYFVSVISTGVRKVRKLVVE